VVHGTSNLATLFELRRITHIDYQRDAFGHHLASISRRNISRQSEFATPRYAGQDPGAAISAETARLMRPVLRVSNVLLVKPAVPAAPTINWHWLRNT
jgi:hypothetical protein